MHPVHHVIKHFLRPYRSNPSHRELRVSTDNKGERFCLSTLQWSVNVVSIRHTHPYLTMSHDGVFSNPNNAGVLFS